MKNQCKMIVGWREWVALPELGIALVKAKLDTGARTSALHAYDVEPFHRDGADWVRFTAHPFQRDEATTRRCTGRVVDERRIMNSGGGREYRYVIETPLRVGGREWPIELTLASRDELGFRMLLGRTAMRRHLVVDPTLSYQTGKPTKAEMRRQRGRT